MNFVIRLNRSALFLISLLIYAVGSQANDATGTKDEGYYRVEDGKVDQDTFLGWNIFHNTCVTCHGVGGSGTDIAPDLTESIKKYTPEKFRIRVLNRYLVTLSADEVRAENLGAVRDAFLAEVAKKELQDPGAMNMPQWESNPVVKARIMNIYGYLKARSDGVLGPEHPEVLKD